MERLMNVVLARPRAVLVAWLLILGASVAFAMQLSGALKAGGFSDPRAEGALAQQTLQGAFDESPNSLLVVLTDESGHVSGRVAAAEGAINGFSPSQVADYRTHRDWISADGRTTFVQAGFSVANTAVQNMVPALESRVAAAVGPAAQVNVTGQPALDYTLNVRSKADAERAELIAFPILIIVLLLVFRSVAAMAVPLVLAGASLAISSGIGYFIAQATDLSILYSNIVSMIGLAVGVDYSLFVIRRFREELRDGLDVDAAVRRAMGTAGRSVVFSGLAVVVALSALFIPRVMAFTSIALGGVVVTVSALVLSLTALPAGLKLLGHRINWGSLTPRKARARVSSSWGARQAAMLRRPALLLGGAAFIFVLLALPIGQLVLQSPVASTTILPANDSARIGMDRINQNIGQRGLYPVEVVITGVAGTAPATMLAAVDRVANDAKLHPAVDGVLALSTIGVPTEVLQAQLSDPAAPLPAPEQTALAQLWSDRGSQIVTRVVITPAQGPDTTATHQLVRDLRADFAGTPTAGVSIAVTGVTAQGVDFDNVVVRSIPIIVAFVALVTFLILMVAFRSLLLPLLALLFNATVVCGSLGILTLVLQDALGRSINSVTPLLLFAVMFGLSMDYMVIMISRMREAYLAGRNHREAVFEGLRHTAAMVNGGAVIMVAVFASFGSAQISIVQEIGIGLAIAVILDAVVIRLVVMPATLLLIGPRVWGRRAVQFRPVPDSPNQPELADAAV